MQTSICVSPISRQNDMPSKSTNLSSQEIMGEHPRKGSPVGTAVVTGPGKVGVIIPELGILVGAPSTTGLEDEGTSITGLAVGSVPNRLGIKVSPVGRKVGVPGSTVGPSMTPLGRNVGITGSTVGPPMTALGVLVPVSVLGMAAGGDPGLGLPVRIAANVGMVVGESESGQVPQNPALRSIKDATFSDAMQALLFNPPKVMQTTTRSSPQSITGSQILFMVVGAAVGPGLLSHLPQVLVVLVRMRSTHCLGEQMSRDLSILSTSTHILLPSKPVMPLQLVKFGQLRGVI